MSMTKSFQIDKELVRRAWKSVKENKGTYGIDNESIEEYASDLTKNLYKLWNRMSSGTYFPQPVRGVDIPKKQGGTRTLGIPAVSDRIGQTIVKLVLEPKIDPQFHNNSYGYRPGRSAHDAIDATRKNCWKWDFLLEFDIRGMFDNIPWHLIMKALTHHTQEKWIILYVERWLKADIIKNNGKEVMKRTKGTPQGGPLSPLLMNLFMHYAFDLWMSREFPSLPWCRYADDGVIHCRTAGEAELVKQRLASRLMECGLEMHSDKTRVVYCADRKRIGNFPNRSFVFLSFEFKARLVRAKTGQMFMGFNPAIAKSAIERIRHTIKYRLRLTRRVDLSLEELAEKLNPIVRGWIQYYGKFQKSEIRPIRRYIDVILAKWVRNKFIKTGGRSPAFAFLDRIYRRDPKLFAHWSI